MILMIYIDHDDNVICFARKVDLKLNYDFNCNGNNNNDEKNICVGVRKSGCDLGNCKVVRTAPATASTTKDIWKEKMKENRD